ncbi:MAG: M20 family metallopeptidase [Spirochaetota bacterium]
MELGKAFELIKNDELLEIVGNLIRIPSHSHTPGQEKEIAKFVEQTLKNWAFDVILQEVEPERFNVITRLKGQSNGKSLLLNGHLDTVPAGEGMVNAYHPVVKEGRLYGRGSADMKAALGAMLYVLFLLKKTEISLLGDLYFSGVVGEESGGTGTRFLVQNGFKADYAVIGEPTDLNLVRSHKGVLQLKAIIRGKAAHAALPEKGANAILKMAEFIQRVEKEVVPKLKKRRQASVGHSTLNFGTIQGGTQTNMVADLCILEIDRRWVKAETEAQVASEIAGLLYEVCRDNPGFAVEITSLLPPGGYFGPFEISEDHKLIKMAKQALEQAGILPKIGGMQGWTDAATLMKAGIPTVLLGPGSLDQAHTNNEFVDLGQLILAVKCYLALTKIICGWKMNQPRA